MSNDRSFYVGNTAIGESVEAIAVGGWVYISLSTVLNRMKNDFNESIGSIIRSSKLFCGTYIGAGAATPSIYERMGCATVWGYGHGFGWNVYVDYAANISTVRTVRECYKVDGSMAYKSEVLGNVGMSNVLGFIADSLTPKIPEDAKRRFYDEFYSKNEHLGIVLNHNVVIRIPRDSKHAGSRLNQPEINELLKKTDSFSIGIVTTWFDTRKNKSLLWEDMKLTFRTFPGFVEYCDKAGDAYVDFMNKNGFEVGLNNTIRDFGDGSSILAKVRETFAKMFAAKSNYIVKYLKGEDIVTVYNNFSCGSCMTGKLSIDHWDAKSLGHPLPNNTDKVRAYALSKNASIACLIQPQSEDEFNKILKSSEGKNSGNSLNSVLLARCMVWESTTGDRFYDRIYADGTYNPTGASADYLASILSGLLDKDGVGKLRAGSVTAGGSFKPAASIECDLKVYMPYDDVFVLPYMDTMRYGKFIDNDTIRVSVNEQKDSDGFPVYSVANSRCVQKKLVVLRCLLSGKMVRSDQLIDVAVVDNKGNAAIGKGNVEGSDKKWAQIASSYRKCFDIPMNCAIFARIEDTIVSKDTGIRWLSKFLPDDLVYLDKIGVVARKSKIITARNKKGEAVSARSIDCIKSEDGEYVLVEA